MSEIQHLRIPPRIDNLPLAERERQNPPSWSWRFQVEGDEFDYHHERIWLNGNDLSVLINEKLKQQGAHYWTALGKRLGRYRDWATVHVEDPESLGKFSAIVHAMLTRIFGRIKKRFDETIDGVSFHLEAGELLLNGLNVHGFLEMAKKHRTEKSRLFLKGLRNRLAILQSNRSGNPNYEKIRDTVDRLSIDIENELRHWVPPVIALPAPAPLDF